ncbi:MAG TPA: DoxX family protein [Terriglobia bacterium]|nr:DoxX family protein [Terriglobia bacterium]
MTGAGSAENIIRSILRIVVGFTFSCHGWQKLFGAFGGLHGHAAHFPHLLWFAGLIETVGGALILLGLFTSPVAFILSGEMATAYFMGHYPHGFYPILNHGELAVVYCFVFLYLFAAGAGPISLDRAFRRKNA